MKHTKGPWEYIKSNGEDGPRVLSEKVTKFGNFYVASCNVDADAKLIAAAPDMLDDLKLTDEMLGELRKDLAGTPADVVIGKWRAMLQRTIAKAETK